MKKILLFALLCSMLFLLLMGCQPADVPTEFDHGAVLDLASIQDYLRQEDPSPRYSEKELREKFPEYFDLGTFKGIEVYAWQSEGVIYCGILTGTNRLKTKEELLTLRSHGATIEEMRCILSSYDLPRESIFVFSLDAFSEFAGTPIN